MVLVSLLWMIFVGGVIVILLLVIVQMFFGLQGGLMEFIEVVSMDVCMFNLCFIGWDENLIFYMVIVDFVIWCSDSVIGLIDFD